MSLREASGALCSLYFRYIQVLDVFFSPPNCLAAVTVHSDVLCWMYLCVRPKQLNVRDEKETL